MSCGNDKFVQKIFFVMIIELIVGTRELLCKLNIDYYQSKITVPVGRGWIKCVG